MAITTINIGNSPNDGSGDSIRVAFNKANQNFIELQTRIGNLATSGGTTGLRVNGPVEITSSATPALFTGTFRLRATAQDPYFDIATTAQGFQGGPVSGITTFTNPQDSASVTTGAVVVAGGLGVSGTSTLADATILGNVNAFRVNMSPGGELYLPDGAPLGNISANLGAYQAWANLTLSTVANAVNQQQAIDTLTTGNLVTQANLGAYQAWANLTLSTVANAVDQQTAINTLTSNAATQSIAISDLNANLGIIYLGNLSTQANLGAYQAWANLTLSTVANAVNQQESIDTLLSNAAAQAVSINDLFSNAAAQATAIGDLQSNAAAQATSIDNLQSNAAAQAISLDTLDANIGTLYLGNIATNANLGAYQDWANLNLAAEANVGTLYLGNIATNANLGAYQVWANLNLAAEANVGTLHLGNISTNANLGAYQLYANANIGTLFLGNSTTNANLGAYQIWANLNLAPLSQPTFVSNLNIDTGANFFVRHNTLSTFGANVDVGSSDGSAANLLVRNGSTATFSSNVEIGSVDGAAANLTVRNGSHATFTTNVTVVPGGNVHVPEGVEFSVYGGNVAVYKSTRIAEYPWPSASTGAAGDRAGMIAFDTNTNTLLVCVANYDGSSSIWANIAGPAGPGLPNW